MGAVSAEPASTPAGTVFLSYASQDAEAAQWICDALRAAGIEVWFDQSELRGGDAWDRHIRERIHDCRLFIAVISANAEARDEGYFRCEWGLAVDRTRDMDEKKAFLLPVVIDDTVERSARVPERFHGIQWTRLLAGLTPPAFVARVRKLLSPGEPDRPAKSHPPPNSVSVAMPAADTAGDRAVHRGAAACERERGCEPAVLLRWPVRGLDHGAVADLRPQGHRPPLVVSVPGFQGR